MSEEDRFDGLAEHVVRHLGPAKRKWTPPEDPGYGAVLHYPEETPLPVVSAVTVGLRFKDIRALKPVELICTLQSGQEAEALHLLNAAAQYLMTADPKPLADFDHMVGGDGTPLIPDTRIHGLLFGVHPVFPDVALFRDQEGGAALQFLTLLPLDENELRWVAEGDPHSRQERLWTRWKQRKVEFWDIRRTASPPPDDE